MIPGIKLVLEWITTASLEIKALRVEEERIPFCRLSWREARIIETKNNCRSDLLFYCEYLEINHFYYYCYWIWIIMN